MSVHRPSGHLRCAATDRNVAALVTLSSALPLGLTENLSSVQVVEGPIRRRTSPGLAHRASGPVAAIEGRGVEWPAPT